MCAVELWRRASPAPKDDVRVRGYSDTRILGFSDGDMGMLGWVACSPVLVPFVAIAVVAANLLLCVLSCDRKRRLLLRFFLRGCVLRTASGSASVGLGAL